MTVVIPCLAYWGVQGIIRSLARKFVNRFGGVWEEVLSDATSVYMESAADWDETRTTCNFETFVRHRVWWGLLDILKLRIREHKRLLPLDDVHAAKELSEPFDLVNYLEALSADGKHLAMMVLETPAVVTKLMKRRGSYSPSSMRLALKEHLTSLGWSSARIFRAFKEVRESL